MTHPMVELVERAYFSMCLAVGRLLRSATYSTVRIVRLVGKVQVQKRRRFYAPVLIRLGNLLSRVLGTGVRVLSQRAWEQRERELYGRVHCAPIQVDVGGVLVLPFFAGDTLAALLEDPERDERERLSAIRLAVRALADFHGRGLTHGDAIAGNVIVDLDEGVARWFDFETVHEAHRSMLWRRADDVRALLATCLVRTAHELRAETLDLILNACADDAATRVLTASFSRVMRLPLAMHLGQAALSLDDVRHLERLLNERLERDPAMNESNSEDRPRRSATTGVRDATSRLAAETRPVNRA